MNQIILSGRLGKDPDIKEFKGGNLSTLNLGVTRRIKKGDNWEDVTDWLTVKSFRDLKFLSKGDQVEIVGELVNNNYENKEGKKVYQNDIIASYVNRTQKFQGGSLAARSQREVAPAGNDDFDWGEEMPF